MKITEKQIQGHFFVEVLFEVINCDGVFRQGVFRVEFSEEEFSVGEFSTEEFFQCLIIENIPKLASQRIIKGNNNLISGLQKFYLLIQMLVFISLKVGPTHEGKMRKKYLAQKYKMKIS